MRVTDLGQALRVSAASIRRDLADLERTADLSTPYRYTLTRRPTSS